jgi:hypothetical protein
MLALQPLFQVLVQQFWYFTPAVHLRLKNCAELLEINSLQLNLALPAKEPT